MRLYAALFITLTTTALHAEPSAFGAGNLESDTPYGLTKTEKFIRKNQEAIEAVEKGTLANQRGLDSLRERLDGVQTVIEGLNDKSNSAQAALEKSSQASSLYGDRLTALEATVSANGEKIAALAEVVETLSVSVDAINRGYVSKREYNLLVEDLSKLKSSLSSSLNIKAESTEDPFEGLSSSQLADRAYKNFKRLYFKYAIPQYEELIRRQYKPAYAHFMIGEMWHYRKECAKALSFYKASTGLHADGDYMPLLLLHTGECMIETKDHANAKRFLGALTTRYPQSSEAKEGRTLLNSLH